MREMQEFLAVVREALKKRLDIASLDLIDIGLREYTPPVLTPGVDQYCIIAWVRRSATGEIASIMTRVGGEFHQTDAEAVAPLITEMTTKLTKHFYPKR